MSEETQVAATADDLLGAAVWGNESQQQNNMQTQAAAADNTNAVDTANTTDTQKDNTNGSSDNTNISFDEPIYLKNNFGKDSLDEVKKELEELNTLRNKPAFTFENADSEKYFNAIKDGKEDDIYSYLNNKKSLEKAEKLDPTDPKQAADILKLNLKYKYPDLTQDEIDYKFNKTFQYPTKPKNDENLTEEENYLLQEDWKAKVQDIERGLVIEAKLAKPDLSKFKTDLKLPDIPKPEAQQQLPDQKSLDAIKAARDLYVNTLDKDYKNVKGFDTTVKGESADIPVSFLIPDEEKSSLKTQLSSFDMDGYFNKRWFNENGSPNIDKLMSDLYLLENTGKVFQGIANNAASKRLEDNLKARGKVNVTGAQQNSQFNPATTQDKFEEAVWSTK